mgnify:CR=1 FL=1
MSMFCYQCQETSKGKGCTIIGTCGKSEGLAKLQDLLVYTLKGMASVAAEGLKRGFKFPQVYNYLIDGLFMTITNVNWDDDLFVRYIKDGLQLRENIIKTLQEKGVVLTGLPDAATWSAASAEEIYAKANAPEVGVLATKDEDIRSLRELITYGIKGMAAYAYHARELGKEKEEIYEFIINTLAKTLDDTLSVNQLMALVLDTGKHGVEVMALLDEANTGAYGHPEITEVNLGVRNNPAILVSGHDLRDLEQLLEQTKGTGVDVYTHGEMLPAHYYPAFKKYDHFVGNYGNAWWQQQEEIEAFRGPVLFTSNCLVPPRKEHVHRIFTTGTVGYPGCKHIEADANGRKDFSEIIELAKQLDPPMEIETGKIVGGFAHSQVLALADKVVEAVQSGAIKKFFVMAGCDGRMKSRSYYTEFAKKLPKDTVILTAGCAKYRYNKLDLGEIGGIPRVLDAGQCNDAYSLALIALKLKEVFGLDDVNELPIAYNIAWYEQKAAIVLLALLYLGVKNIHLGPTLPAFLSPNVTKMLEENFGIAGIGTVDEDMEMFMAQ